MSTTDSIRFNQPALSKRGRVPESESTRFIREALADIRAYMNEHDLDPVGPPFAISRPTADVGRVDIEVGWPLQHEAVGAGAIHSATLPCTVVRHRQEEATLV